MRSRSIRLVVVALAGAAVLATGLLAQASSTGDAGGPAVRLARLNAAKEVPWGGAAGGTGVSTVIVHPSQGRLCFSIAVEGIELPAVRGPRARGTSRCRRPSRGGTEPAGRSGQFGRVRHRRSGTAQGDQADPVGE